MVVHKIAVKTVLGGKTSGNESLYSCNEEYLHEGQ